MFRKLLLPLLLLTLVLSGAPASAQKGKKAASGTPAAAVERYFFALKKLDWGTLYSLTAFNDKFKAICPDKATFVKFVKLEADKDIKGKAEMQKAMNDVKTFRAKNTKLAGSKADVTTNASIQVEPGTSVSMTGMAHLVKQEGVWKLDATKAGEEDPSGIGNILQEMLIGKKP